MSGDLAIDNGSPISPFDFGFDQIDQTPAVAEREQEQSAEQQLLRSSEKAKRPVYSGEFARPLQELQGSTDEALKQAQRVQGLLDIARNAITTTVKSTDSSERSAQAKRASAALQMLVADAGKAPDQLEKILAGLESLRLAIPENDPLANQIGEKIRHAHEQIFEMTKALAKVLPGGEEIAKNSPMGEVNRHFRDRLSVIGDVMQTMTTDWKKGLELTRTFQRFQILIAEYANEKSFDYSDRSKYPELNELHDRMEQSGIFKWTSRGWKEGDKRNYAAMKENLGLAVQIATSKNKQDEIDASNMMNNYNATAMFLISVNKLVTDLVKQVARALMG